MLNSYCVGVSTLGFLLLAHKANNIENLLICFMPGCVCYSVARARLTSLTHGAAGVSVFVCIVGTGENGRCT